MHRKNSAGFTLVEVMVVVMITGVVSTALFQMLSAGQASYTRNKILVDMQQNGRVGIQSLSDDLRQVSYGKDPTQPSIEYAGPESVTFVADIMPEHTGAEFISYFLSQDGDPDTDNPNDTLLMRVIADSGGVVLISSPQSYGVSDLSFRWFNGSGVELANPVPQPEQVGEIYVDLTTTAARAMNGEYPEITLSSTIYPRNLPLSPARSRPSTPSCTGPVYPNCESATVDWATPTTNTDGTDLPLGDISHFNFYFGTDPDDMSLYTRLARTINQWTINGLDPGTPYYLGVSCVSRSGVESYLCTRQAVLTSTLIPKQVQNLTAVTGAGVTLAWNAVTQFTDDTTIGTPVTYNIYRSETSGFTPSVDTYVASVQYTTTYTDPGPPGGCGQFYYLVAAEACGNEGDPSNEVDGTLPALASCPSGISLSLTSNEGEVVVTFTPPATRVDGSPLLPEDIASYRVYADSVSGSTDYYVEVDGESSSAVLSDLVTCTTYFVNVQAVDACGHLGDFCAGQEQNIFTSAPCDASPPSRPSTLTVVSYDDRLALEWPANNVDCDVKGYRIYYGHASDGPYDGDDAEQGSSPVEVLAADVTVGDICRFDLTGLPTCQNYYIEVKTFDQCSPANESEASPQGSGSTVCTPCQINSNCIAWAVSGASDHQLNLELYTENSAGETLNEITPTWTGAQLLREVWFGRPLVKIWSHDGSAGDDGNIGPVSSGTTVRIDPVQIPNWTLPEDGEPLQLLFGGDIRDRPVTMDFRADQGTCSAAGTGRDALIFDAFDDGDYSGWSPVTGTWFVTNGELNQSSTSGNHIILHSSSGISNTTMEAKVFASGGSTHSVYLVFRYQNSSNYYLVGIRTDDDKVRAARVQSGTFVQTGVYFANLVDNTWYTLRAVVTGNRVRVYLDCDLVIDVTDGSMWSTGKVGLTSRAAAGRFDDIRVFNAEVLP